VTIRIAFELICLVAGMVILGKAAWIGIQGIRIKDNRGKAVFLHAIIATVFVQLSHYQFDIVVPG